MSYLYLAVQIILIIIMLIACYFLLRTITTLSKEKRISKFAIEALSDKPLSFSEKIQKSYTNIIKKIGKTAIKIKSLKEYSKKYEKYTIKNNQMKNESIDFIAKKILFSFIAIFLTIISDVLRFKMFTILQILLSALIGFFILDIFLFFRRKKDEKQIEEDLLKAVIIMNNAFKSGRSIMQAVELVSNELTGPISNEFKKIFIDLTYGLELQVVFDRFANRVNLEEVKYMSSSLVILNQTGGKVTKIFSSIERSFLERKKIKDEMNSTLALSNLVFKVLTLIPFIIFIIIFFMDPTYFVPFIKNPIGNLMLAAMIIIYALYIIMVNKIVKIRE